MKGSIKQQGASSFRIRVYTGKDPITGSKTYHQETVDGPTKAKAEKAAHARMAEIVADLNKGTWVSPDKATYEEYLTKRFLPFKKARLRQTSYDQIESFVRVHIIPALGKVELRRLTPLMFDNFYDALLATGKKRGGKGLLSRETVRDIHAVCLRSLRQAVKWRLLAANPVEAATPPEREDKEPEAYSVEEARAFVAGIKGDPFEAAYLLYLLDALRRGEAAGLEWPAVAFDLGGFRIEKSIVQTSQGSMESEPKTKKSKGFMPGSVATMNALAERKIVQMRERADWENKCGPGSYMVTDRVFTMPDGRPVTPNYLYQHFREITARLGLRSIPLHALRKTGANLFYRVTQDIRQVKDHLRHTKVATTDKWYVAGVPEFQIAALKEMDKLLGLSPADELEDVGCQKDVKSEVQ